jgi:hypothetical protein
VAFITRERERERDATSFTLVHNKNVGGGSHMGSRWATAVGVVQEQRLVGGMPPFSVVDAALEAACGMEYNSMLLGVGCLWFW